MTAPDPAAVVTRVGSAVREPGAMSLAEPVPETQTYACPRCQAQVTEAWYGPCDPCRVHLRATVGGVARDIAAEDYVPKMNVTPNAVASKD
ncbi:MAG: hypothetical protein JWM47_2638 [Acidimicrobiales bacterium]|nr:hypothetical protein [Acidimicrobiales bacterium]